MISVHTFHEKIVDARDALMFISDEIGIARFIIVDPEIAEAYARACAALDELDSKFHDKYDCAIDNDDDFAAEPTEPEV